MKRIWAFFMSVLFCLSAFPMLGRISLPSAAEGELPPSDTVVTEIAFTATENSWCDAVYRSSSQSETNPYTVSFDYYLPYGQTVTFSSVAGFITRLAGSDAMTLRPGYNTFTMVVTTSASGGTFAPRLTSTGATTLYMWNYHCTIGGAAASGSVSQAATWRTAKVTAGAAITGYPWYEHMQSPFVLEMDFLGATVESPKSWTESKGMYFGGVDATSAYTVTFDYYVPSVANSLAFTSVSGGMTTVSGSNVLDGSVGLHSFSWTTYSSAGSGNKAGQFVPRITSDTPIKLYIWNYRVDHLGMEGNCTSSVSGTVSSAITPVSGNQLYTYDWYTADDGDDEETERELPVSGNAAIRYSEKHSVYDTQAEAMRLRIVNAADEVIASTVGTTYYVSYTGSNSNDGLTPATAWYSTDAVAANSSKLQAGDVVLFERGGVYRGTTRMVSGVSYGAYGTGSKPCLYAGPRNYADASLWESVTTNIWRVNVGSMSDVGNIVFEHGEVCASDYKICDPTLMTIANLTSDYQYYHDRTNGYIVMYYAHGNPGALFDSIEFCPNNHIFVAANSTANSEIDIEDVTIDNLCIKYTGAHGIVFGRAENITVTNCEIGYIGGSMLDESVRYGNGIEFYTHASDVLVENNWIYQCYDAGYTNQGSGNATHLNITVKNNLIEYCTYNIEIFTGKENGLIKDCVYEDNMLRFAGYGFGVNNRYGSNDSVASSINYWLRVNPCQNVIIRDNILDISYRFLLVAAYVNDAQNRGPIVTGNTWNQHDGPKSSVALQVDTDVSGWNNLNQFVLPSNTYAQMKASVAAVDTAPKAVQLEGVTVTSVSITSAPTKILYTIGDTLDTSGLTLAEVYSDNSFVPITSGYMLSGFDSSTAGTKTVTVTYGDKTAAFYVTVNTAGTQVTDPTVTEIVFPENNGAATTRWSPNPGWYFGGVDASTAYTVTFEYYLPQDVASLNLDSVSGFMQTLGGSRSLPTAAGHHTVSWITCTNVGNGDRAGQFIPYISAPVGTEMYIWNWNVKQNGTDAVVYDRSADWNGHTNGTVGGALSTYSWASTIG